MDLLEQAVQRGESARQLLVSEVFVEAHKSLKDGYIRALLATQDRESRETVWLKIKVLEEVISELGIIEQNGVKADHDIKQRRRRAAN